LQRVFLDTCKSPGKLLKNINVGKVENVNLSIKCEWSASCPSHFTPRETVPLPTESEVAWAAQPVWRFWRKGKSLDPARIQTLNRPDHT
jgi:hypothetical protein